MILWLVIIILSYLFLSLSFFGDKLILSGPPNPKLFTFYVSVISILIVFLIPFTKFTLPNFSGMIWATLEAIVYILSLYTMFVALEKFEVSRVMPATGAVQPILILILTWIFWGNQTITGTNLLAFILLIAGGIIISFEKKLKITSSYLILILVCSLMFSLDYIFSKLVFLNQPFLQGLIWMRIFTFILSLFFLFDKKIRNQIFYKQKNLIKKDGTLFLFTQSFGGMSNIMQSFAISLAPIGYLAIINSLRGIQYVFLFIITLFFSFFFPKILKENISRRVVLQKTISILLIVIGLTILVIK